MSLCRARTLSLIAALALAAVLILDTGWHVRAIAGVILLAGSVPWWRMTIGIARAHGERRGRERTLMNVTAALLPPDRRDTPRSEPATRDLLSEQRSAGAARRASHPYRQAP